VSLAAIDVHAHYFPVDYLELIESLGSGEVNTSAGRRSSWPTTEADLRERLATMDRMGIERQILSIASAGPYLRDESAARRAARFVNNAYADAVREHHGRLSAFAALPLPHVDAALHELDYALDELGMVGVWVATEMAGLPLDDERFAPIYEELDRRRAVLFVHPIGLSCDSPLLARTNLTWPLGAPFEDSAAALQLLQSGFARRYPHVKVIVPHLGGTLPFLVERLDHMADRFMRGEGLPSTELKKFWYDTVNAHPAALRCACDTFGAQRLLLGTDYPFWQGHAHDLGVSYLEHAGLSAAELAAIRGGTARRLFAPHLRA